MLVWYTVYTMVKKIAETVLRSVARFITWHKAKRMKKRVKQGRKKAAKTRAKSEEEKQQRETEEYNRTHCDWCKSTVPKDALVCLKCNRLTDKQAQIDKEEREHRQVTVTQTQNSKGGSISNIFWGLFCFFILLPAGLILLIGLIISMSEVV